MWYMLITFGLLLLNADGSIKIEIHCELTCNEFSGLSRNRMTLCGNDDLSEKICGTEIECDSDANVTSDSTDQPTRHISDAFPCCYAYINTTKEDDDACKRKNEQFLEAEGDDKMGPFMLEETAGETLAHIVQRHSVLTILVLIALVIEISFVVWQSLRCYRKHQKAFYLSRPPKKDYIISVAKFDDSKKEPLTGVKCEKL